MLNIYKSVNNYFSEQLNSLNCSNITKAYIVSVLSKYKHSNFDYSKEKITLIYYEAMLKNDFYTFQNIGDWIFICETMFPAFLQETSKNYYHSVAQISYYNCYKLINKKLHIYEELSDEFPSLISKTKILIHNI